MATESQWIGLKEANAALKRLPEFAKARAQKEMDVTAFQVARGAEARLRARVAHWTGFLGAHSVWQSRPRSVSAVVGVDNPLAYYWKYLEYGTVHDVVPHVPFMRPAAEANRDDHHRALVSALEKAADDVEHAQGSIGGMGTGLL